MAPRKTENNAYAKFRGDEQRTLWYVMVFSGVVNCCLVYLLYICVTLKRKLALLHPGRIRWVRMVHF